MPPLKSNPNIVNAIGEQELSLQMNRFMDGKVAYIKAHEIGGNQSFDLFAPARTDYHLAIGGLMMDGVSMQPIAGEYFGDYRTYVEMRATAARNADYVPRRIQTEPIATNPFTKIFNRIIGK